LFAYIAGVDLDDRIAWVIDELCEVLRACDLHLLMQEKSWFARCKREQRQRNYYLFVQIVILQKKLTHLVKVF
jgi:hypothetical protein